MPRRAHARAHGRPRARRAAPRGGVPLAAAPATSSSIRRWRSRRPTRAEVQHTARRWLAWYEALFAEPPARRRRLAARTPGVRGVGGGAAVRRPVRRVHADRARVLRAAISTGASFDLNREVNLAPPATDRSSRTSTETVMPAPVNFRGAPAVRFWEIEDARVDYGADAGRPDRPAAPAADRVREQLRQRLVSGAARPAGRIAHRDRLARRHRHLRRAHAASADRRPRAAARRTGACSSSRTPPATAASDRRATCSSCAPSLAHAARRPGARGSAVHARRDGQHGLGDRARDREPARAAAERDDRRADGRQGTARRAARSAAARDGVPYYDLSSDVPEQLGAAAAGADSLRRRAACRRD